jgi:hypothetical protein
MSFPIICEVSFNGTVAYLLIDTIRNLTLRARLCGIRVRFLSGGFVTTIF